MSDDLLNEIKGQLDALRKTMRSLCATSDACNDVGLDKLAKDINSRSLEIHSSCGVISSLLCSEVTNAAERDRLKALEEAAEYILDLKAEMGEETPLPDFLRAAIAKAKGENYE